MHIARTSLLRKFTSCDSFDLLSYMQSADLLLYIISDYSFGNSLESNSYSEKGPRDLCFLIKPDGLPWRLSGKKSTCLFRRYRFDPCTGVGKIPWRRKWQRTPVFLPGKSHHQRSLAGYTGHGVTRFRHDGETKQQQQITSDGCKVLLY